MTAESVYKYYLYEWVLVRTYILYELQLEVHCLTGDRSSIKTCPSTDQRSQDKLKFIFRCQGENIAKNLNKINALIGKESLTKRLATSQPVSVPKVSQSSMKESTKKSMKVIGVYHHKGGVGKTTVSTHLAAAFSNQGNRS